jgi:phosphatidylglycerol:prolipoprotein diacylglycerol transferase
MGVLFYLLLKKNLPKGSIAAIFLLLIGSLRFTTEFIRQPDDQVGFVLSWLTMGQILATLTIIAGAVLLYLRFQGAKKVKLHDK